MFRFAAAALIAVLALTSGALGFLYVRELGIDRHDHGQALALSAQKVALTKDNAGLETLISDLRSREKHPTLGMWNMDASLSSANQYLIGSVPDTFSFHLEATSSSPMSVSILSFAQFERALNCTHAGGTADYCMHHQGALDWVGVTSVNYDFHDAEGCAAYIDVWTAAAPTTIHPNLKVTYSPAPAPTGSCLQPFSEGA